MGTVHLGGESRAAGAGGSWLARGISSLEGEASCDGVQRA